MIILSSDVRAGDVLASPRRRLPHTVKTVRRLSRVECERLGISYPGVCLMVSGLTNKYLRWHFSLLDRVNLLSQSHPDLFVHRFISVTVSSSQCVGEQPQEILDLAGVSLYTVAKLRCIRIKSAFRQGASSITCTKHSDSSEFL